MRRSGTGDSAFFGPCPADSFASASASEQIDMGFKSARTLVANQPLTNCDPPYPFRGRNQRSTTRLAAIQCGRNISVRTALHMILNLF